MKKRAEEQSIPQLSPNQLRAKSQKLLRDGNMPTLEEFAGAVLEARQKYATKIRRARRIAREKVAVN